MIKGTLTPEQVGIETRPTGSLEGGDAQFNLSILHRVLDGKGDGYGDAVAYNSGAMIYVAGKADSIEEGVAVARAAILDGRAKEKLDAWVRMTRT
jgi:anthranilate phosphoribosyltransferase